MMKTGLAAAVALAAISLAAPAQAEILDNFQFKLGVSGVLPNESASIAPIGGEVEISDEWAPSLQIEYFSASGFLPSCSVASPPTMWGPSTPASAP